MSKTSIEKCRVRFAPSPTGFLHVGGARTALFNWLIARHFGGTFVLRIEDTDRARSTAESVEAITRGLTWLGLDWDEGPFFQADRTELYRAAAKQLIDAGRAYPCFCSKERLDEVRKQARKDNRPSIYDGTCRNIEPQIARSRIAEGESHSIRFAIEAGGVVEFDDVIGGPRRFENDLLGDFVILRSDGSPIYHLSCVVDDHEMAISHVIRGDDHLANTPRQLLLFAGLDWEPPRFAHLPLIQGPDRARLSKRHGATNLMEFASEGFLPDAMFNFLALLGWSLDAETEIISREKLIQNFTLDRINRSAAIFDRTKLEWMNGVYMKNLGASELAPLARDFFRELNVPEDWLTSESFESHIALEIERSRTLKEMREHLDYFFVDAIDHYEEKPVRKHFQREGATRLLEQIASTIKSLPEFDEPHLDPALKQLAETEGISFGKIVHPLRLALTGRAASPGIYDVLAGLGKAKSLDRIDRAKTWIEAQKDSAVKEPEEPSGKTGAA